MLDYTKRRFTGSFAVLGIAKSNEINAAGTVPSGTVGALRVTVTAMYMGKAVLPVELVVKHRHREQKDWLAWSTTFRDG